MRKSMFLLLFAGLILSVSFTLPGKISGNQDPAWLPPDFDPAKGILLIEAYGINMPKTKIGKYMAKYYPYKYEFFDKTQSARNLEAYKDKEMYHFLIQTDVQELIFRDRTREIRIDHNFVDRLTGKGYPVTGQWAAVEYWCFKHMMDKILKIKSGE